MLGSARVADVAGGLHAEIFSLLNFTFLGGGVHVLTSSLFNNDASALEGNTDLLRGRPLFPLFFTSGATPIGFTCSDLLSELGVITTGEGVGWILQ